MNSVTRKAIARNRGRPRLLLMTAAGIHLSTTMTVYLAGRAGSSALVSNQNGTGLSVEDARGYIEMITILANLLRHGHLNAWFNAAFPLHIKLYSVPYAFFSPVVGSNIIAVEPLNQACYLAILILVYKLGSEVFDRRAGLVAAGIVSVWPTLLFHTTQILKDPIYIVAWLGLVFLSMICLTRSLCRRQLLILPVIGAALLIFLWRLRSDLWVFSLLVVITTPAFLLIGFRRKTSLRWNLILTCALLIVAFLIPALVRPYRNPVLHPVLANGLPEDVTELSGRPQLSSSERPVSGLSAWSMTLRERIASTRFGFTRYPGSGSNLDEEVRFDSWRAMACYVPRALVIGFFAPFPQMWFVSGAEVGRTGRLLAGVETASMYVVELLTLMALWRNRRQASAWFLAALATAGMACLGLVVANVGALYRMRYGFWILLIVIAASQMIQLQSNVTRTQKA